MRNSRPDICCASRSSVNRLPIDPPDAPRAWRRFPAMLVRVAPNALDLLGGH